MTEYFVPTGASETELVEKRSRFLGHVWPVESEEEARAMIVSGFADSVAKELPLEYAAEMNNLIRMEMKGSIG